MTASSSSASFIGIIPTLGASPAPVSVPAARACAWATVRCAPGDRADRARYKYECAGGAAPLD
jgi:hypothetical protein